MPPRPRKTRFSFARPVGASSRPGKPLATATPTASTASRLPTLSAHKNPLPPRGRVRERGLIPSLWERLRVRALLLPPLLTLLIAACAPAGGPSAQTSQSTGNLNKDRVLIVSIEAEPNFVAAV